MKLSLIVTDRSNHSRDDVNKDEVQVFEDKVPQTVSIFAKDDRPVNCVIAIDRSGSFKDLLSPALDAIKLLINSNRELDQTMLIGFVDRDKIETFQNFTPDKSKLVESLRLLRIEGGQSAVIDAIYLAVQATAAYKAGDSAIRRAVVLISDGEDRASYYNTDALIKLLRAKDVQVFIVGIVSQLDNSSGFSRQSPREAAEKLLSRVALETGGRLFFPKNVSQLTQAMGEIIHDLHAQYIIGYEPKNSASNENFRKIEVKMIESPGRERLMAVTRSGYYINPPDLEGKEKKKKSK
ncbi:MAG TPA: VWA domain-containing protein [Pyrinomonadaceae bacterium]|nr:VWA domain-containing protein [Pyrinomonadaceae bacterium]